MQSIPFQRFIIYLLILGLIAPVWALFYASSRHSSITILDETLTHTLDIVSTIEAKQATNKTVSLTFKDADHFYIDKYLESLNLLNNEQEELEVLINGQLPVSEQSKKRYEFLISPQNHLSFSESAVQTFPYFQETTETLMHPVEINTQDLFKILAYVEGTPLAGSLTPPGRPQMIITDFKLEKKEIAPKHQVFQLNMKLLKREFL